MLLRKSLSAFGCLLLPVAAFADVSTIQQSNNQISLYALSTHVDYTEYSVGVLGTPTGILDTETGNVPGYGVSASMMKDLWLGNDYLALAYEHANGHTQYVGSYIGGGAYGSVVDTSGATLDDYNIRLGKGFAVKSTTMLVPYIEIGHNKWYRGVNDGETYSHHYFGGGVLAQYSPSKKLVLSANLLAGYTFGSYIDITGAFAGSLGNSPLYKAGAAIDYAFTPQWHGKLDIDYTRFEYGMSALYPYNSGYAWEPDSKTRNTTVRLGLGYAF